MNKNPLEVFRTRMKETRLKKGLSLKEISEYVKCTEATIQRYESGNGIKNVPYETVVLIAEILGVTPAYLMGWEKPKMDAAELLADIAGDEDLLDCVKKLIEMNIDDREKVYSYIDYIVSTKKQLGS